MDNEADVLGAVHETGKVAGDCVFQAAIQPIAGECVADPDGEGILIVGYKLGVSHPGFIG
jgi:hypothetical protein